MGAAGDHSRKAGGVMRKPSGWQDPDVGARRPRMKLGATGKYPQGSYGRHDEGELAIGITRDRYGNIRIDFGNPVAWLAFSSEQGIELAKVLLKHAGAKKIEIEL
jgi:hypothetical protein